MNTKLLFWFPKALFIPIMIVLIALLSLQTVRATGVCYVQASAGGANNGSSWADAYTDLQSALGASPCTEVWVAAGTYKPTSGTDRAISFVLKNGVALYGGFAGTETARTERNPTENLTTLSGDIGTTGNTADNSYHVVSSSGINATAVLDGFTIMAGNASGTYPADRGGGIYNENSSPTLTDVTFNGNSAYGGGGMWNDSSNPTLTNVTFNGNSATDGGGIYNFSSSPTLTNVTFNGNLATDGGGGMYNFNSSPTLTNATFSSNLAGSFGGGMVNDSSSYSTLTNVTFSNNSAPYGGGMENYSSSPQIMDSIFWNNSASVVGAEIYNYNDTSIPDLADNVVAGGCPSFSTCTNILTTDPLLGPLTNNGGFTQTIALGVGSSAIDTGNDDTCASTDQRGVARPQGVHCDMGAYEWVYPYQIYLPLVIR